MMQRRQLGCWARTNGLYHYRQSPSSTRENDEEQGDTSERPRLVTEMLQKLPMGVRVRNHPVVREAVQKGVPSTGCLECLGKPHARIEKGLRGFRAFALLGVFSKWYTLVLAGLLHEEKEPIQL